MSRIFLSFRIPKTRILPTGLSADSYFISNTQNFRGPPQKKAKFQIDDVELSDVSDSSIESELSNLSDLFDETDPYEQELLNDDESESEPEADYNDDVRAFPNQNPVRCQQKVYECANQQWGPWSNEPPAETMEPRLLPEMVNIVGIDPTESAFFRCFVSNGMISL